MVFQLELAHPELQLRRLHQLRELLQGDGAIPRGVNGLEEPSDLAVVGRDVSLLLPERELLIRARGLHGLLHKDRAHHVQDRKAQHAPVEQEEDGEYLRNMIHQHPAWRAPVGEHDLKERQDGASEGAVVAPDHLSELIILCLVMDEFRTKRAQDHASDALHEGEQTEAPEEHVLAGSQALHKKLQRAQHAGHGHHAHGAHQLADAQQPEEDGVHRQRERVVERDLR
mmetsp:Transcript_46333/g.110128  ORF Transcript_46333/g.110128 Transcript_46333/m.110128 type:complete len:227 (-) Transcript_46333:982-1662(-)